MVWQTVNITLRGSLLRMYISLSFDQFFQIKINPNFNLYFVLIDFSHCKPESVFSNNKKNTFSLNLVHIKEHIHISC